MAVRGYSQPARGFKGKALTCTARLFIAGWAIRNIAGLIATIPIFTAMIHAGGTPMAIWIAACSVAGVALNIGVPWLVYRRTVAWLSASEAGPASS